MYTTAQEVIDALDGMAKQAIKVSGQSYEVYIRSVSGMIDAAVAGLSAEDQAAVRAVAVATVDYAMPEDLEAQEAAMREEGYCWHGLTEDTCPCGCFEHDDFVEEPTLPALEYHYLEVIRLRAWEAQAEIYGKVLPIYDRLTERVGDHADNAYVDACNRLGEIDFYLSCL